jgi:hypothetical protein
MVTPMILSHLKPSLKKVRPITTVKRGTNEFNIPVNELLISVCANGNKNAGIPLPSKPAIAIGPHWFDFIFLKFLTIIGDRKINEITILKDAT